MMPRDKTVFYIIVIVGVIFLTIYWNIIPHIHYFDSRIYVDNIDTAEQGAIVKALKKLATAHRFSRSGKTRLAILEAYESLRPLVKDYMPKYIENVNGNTSVNSIGAISDSGLQEACAETWGGDFDHPLYNKGFHAVPCKEHPLENLVTVVLLARNCSQVDKLVAGLNAFNQHLPIVLGVQGSAECKEHDQVIKHMSGLQDDGASWSRLFSSVTTKYTLVGRGLVHFDNQSNLRRLVRIANATLADIVAGSARRYDNGQWKPGCEQMGLVNYTLKLVEGYDLSFNSCMYCDHVSGPFLARTGLLTSRWKEKLAGPLAFTSFLAKLFHNDITHPLVCPDVMFHVDPTSLVELQNKRTSWIPLAIELELNRVVLPNLGYDFHFTCQETKTSCRFQGGLVVPPCCLQELSDAYSFLFHMCTKHNIHCESEAGSLLGSVKMRGLLPWERDADMNFRMENLTAFEKLIPEFEARGYKLVKSYVTNYKTDLKGCARAGNHGCVYFAYRTGTWRIEMWGDSYLVSDRRGGLAQPTRVQFNGQWQDSYTNPANAMRNAYGDDLFQHIEHWMTLGYSTSHSRYTDIARGRFLRCPRPGFHGCLDRFLVVGNLQFFDVWV